MTYIRLRYQKQGGHIHCRLFTSQTQNGTYAKCGDLVFDEREWPEVMSRFKCGGAEVLEEGANPEAKGAADQDQDKVLVPRNFPRRLAYYVCGSTFPEDHQTVLDQWEQCIALLENPPSEEEEPQE